MIIGIDFDGTIADTNSQKSAWIQKELNREVPPYLCDRSSCIPLIGELEYKRMCSLVYNRDATLALPAVPRALESISILQKKHQLIVVTSRAEDILDSARIWLLDHSETKNLELIGVTKEVNTKAEVCHKKNIQVMIDDDERHFHNIVSAGIMAILFKQSSPKLIRADKIPVCNSWNGIMRYLSALVN